MKQQYVKTTIEIDSELLYQAKMRALEQGISLKKLFTEGVKIVVKRQTSIVKKPGNSKKLTKLQQFLDKMVHDKTVYWDKEDDKRLLLVRKKSQERLKSLQW